ncbi:MAG: tryptophan-rich sensory protein [Spirochaetales bacterium]|nr:tryptophan-rich sensory protein [Spirochaetales bacterium]
MEKTFSFSIWAFINLIAFIAVVVVNGMANSLPLNGFGTGELSDLYPNLFVPAGITFAIWGIIYLLLAGFSVYGLTAAFSKNIETLFLREIGPWFLISCMANICWIFAWHWKKVGLSLFFMLIILASLIILYRKIGIGSGELSKRIFIFTKLPFSIYLGWITVATIANITALLVNLNWNGFGISETVWTVIVIIAAVIITCLVIYRQKDWGYALVVLWAFIGIILKRSSAGDAPAVVTAAGAGMAVIAAFYAVKQFILK